MELALTRRPIAEGAEGHRLLASEPGRVRDACSFGDPARNHLRDRRDQQLAVAVATAGDVAACRERVAGLGEDRQHPLPHRQPAHDRVRQAPVVRDQPVFGRQSRGRGDLDALVAPARPDKRRTALLDEHVHAVVQGFRHAHPAVKVQVLLASRRLNVSGCRHQAVRAFAISTTSSAVSPIRLR